MKSRIMYIEQKTGDSGNRLLVGARAFIGRVTFSKSGKSIYYRDKIFVRTDGVYGNYVGYDRLEYEAWVNAKEGTVKLTRGEEYWISGPKKDGSDRLYETPVVHIDEDVQEEYWSVIRGQKLV